MKRAFFCKCVYYIPLFAKMFLLFKKVLFEYSYLVWGNLNGANANDAYLLKFHIGVKLEIWILKEDY